MIKPELNDKLVQTFETCSLHLRRMEFAKSKVTPFIPLTRENYDQLDDETIGFLDQFIFRFSKLQDTMGVRLFPAMLEVLAEPVSDQAFIDILNRLEKLGILDSALRWVQLRKIRNDVAHEYPAGLPERIAGINLLFASLDDLQQILVRCKSIFEKNG
jgi:hypothetical protein